MKRPQDPASAAERAPSPEPGPLAEIGADLLDDLALARLAGQRAAAFIAHKWRTGVDVAFKGAIDPVTEADLGAERIITELIRARFPEDRVVAEESGAHGGDGPRTWLVDPLDGTTNFSHGLPHFCVSIACADAHGLRVGVIVEPIRRWTFEAARGGGAWLEGRRLGVSATARLDRAVIATGFPYDRHTAHDNNSHRFAAALRVAQGLRRAGSAALDLAYVAAGWLDGYWEARLQRWDLAAGALLVQEAGGRLTDFRGEPWRLGEDRIVATNGRIHDPLLDVLARSDAAFARGDAWPTPDPGAPRADTSETDP